MLQYVFFNFFHLTSLVVRIFQSQVARDCEVTQAKKVLDSMKADYREVWSGVPSWCPKWMGSAK